MRLFVAIELDEAAREAVAEEQRRLARAVAGHGIRWLRADQIHVTLAFLGEGDAAMAEGVVAAMGRPLPSTSFTMICAGLGVFPPRGAPSVLWLGIRGGRDQVTSVQRLTAERLGALGFPAEARAYHPHLTIARYRERRGSRE